jgi:putative SOS response-associated peptidase YedK
MCGRFVLTASPEAIQTAFNLTTVPEGLTARYNVAPSQPVAVITNEDPKTLTFHRWGLIPSWAKDIAIGNKLINARADTAAEKPSFRAAFRRRRCLIPANGFYEWQKRTGGKAPMFIHLKEYKVFAFAGLWEVWHSPDGDELRTCTILTTEPNDFVRSIHDRMPVILQPSDYEKWLAPGEQSPDALKPLMKPLDAALMTAHEVSKLVNKATVDTPELIAPVA